MPSSNLVPDDASKESNFIFLDLMYILGRSFRVWSRWRERSAVTGTIQRFDSVLRGSESLIAHRNQPDPFFVSNDQLL
jgi:hypothetical protein